MKRYITNFILICYSFIFSSFAYGQNTIRDEELESVIRELANPIFLAAGLDSRNIDIYILQNSEINAFVSGGQNIFFNTGLLSLSTSPELVMGTLAHETGHISGGHLSRNRQASKDAVLKNAIGYVLGAATAFAGSAAAGQAIIAGSQHAAGRQFLSHTRSNEEAADQAAISYLEQARYHPRGLLELLELLYHREKISFGNVLDPYVLTHPLSSERISHIRNHLKNNKMDNSGFSEDERKRYALAIVKLRAFLEPPEESFKRYPNENKSEEANYARAIAYYRQPDLKSAINEVDILINNHPENPFYHELKGQMLIEHGRVKESVPHYEKALELLPQSSLFKMQLASAYIATEEKKYLNKAIDLLNQAKSVEVNNPFLWHQLGVAYGRNGELGNSNLALAEEAVLKRNKKAANRFIDMAESHIKPGTTAYLRFLDIKNTIEKDL